MPWLRHTDDEVTTYHPAFRASVDEVLLRLGVASSYQWEHHVHSTGVSIVPDFVLVHTATNRWLLVVEVKRTRSAVYSLRNQVQAKGYAEAGGGFYTPGRAKYFAVTNLEASLLFAVNGSAPPQDCRVKDMSDACLEAAFP